MRILRMLEQYRPLLEDMKVRLFPITSPAIIHGEEQAS